MHAPAQATICSSLMKQVVRLDLKGVVPGTFQINALRNEANSLKSASFEEYWTVMTAIAALQLYLRENQKSRQKVTWRFLSLINCCLLSEGNCKILPRRRVVIVTGGLVPRVQRGIRRERATVIDNRCDIDLPRRAASCG
jgi:hypothetical protein